MPEVLYPPKGILALLDAAGVKEAGAWHVATGRLVDKPDKMVVISSPGGRSSEPVVAQDYPTVQLLVRGAKGSGGQEAAYLKAKECRAALLGIPSRPTEYENLSSVTAIGDVTDVGYDDADRPIFSVNLQLIVFYETSGYREAV